MSGQSKSRQSLSVHACVRACVHQRECTLMHQRDCARIVHKQVLLRLEKQAKDPYSDLLNGAEIFVHLFVCTHICTVQLAYTICVYVLSSEYKPLSNAQVSRRRTFFS